MKERSNSEQQRLVDQRLKSLEKLSPLNLRKVICGIKNAEGFNSAGLVEAWLRQNEREVYLLAVPVDSYDLLQGEVKLIKEEDIGYPFKIEIANGRNQKEKLAMQFGLNLGENLNNLEQAGFKFPFPGSKEARVNMAIWN